MVLVPRPELVYTSLLVSQTRVLGMFDNLSERLSGVLRSLTGKSTLTENNIQEALSDVTVSYTHLTLPTSDLV